MPSRAGQLVITELMIDPKTLSDTEGEWFEMQNVSAQAFDLQGCDIDDGGKDLRAIDASTVVQPRAYVTVARRDAPGFVPSYVASISFTNSADTLALRCSGVDIDRVSYDKTNGFPLVTGASMALDPTKTRADANDDAGVWCAARESYGPELGTPGAENLPCDSDDAGTDAH